MAVTQAELEKIIKITLNAVDKADLSFSAVECFIEEKNKEAFHEAILFLKNVKTDGDWGKANKGFAYDFHLYNLKKEIKEIIKGFTKDQFVGGDFDKRMENIVKSVTNDYQNNYVNVMLDAHFEMVKKINASTARAIFIENGVIGLVR